MYFDSDAIASEMSTPPVGFGTGLAGRPEAPPPTCAAKVTISVAFEMSGLA
jgi:hypothetical protein